MERGVELFEAGRYWEAHEAWEEAWIPDRHGPDRNFFKGLIQVAAGLLHLQRGNRRGALNKLTSGAGLLRPYGPAHHGVALGPLVAEADRLVAALQAGGMPEARPPRLRPGG